MIGPWEVLSLLTEPSDWPLWVRRVLIILFPITVPVWAIVVLTYIVLLTAFTMIAMPFLWANDLWKDKQ